MLLRCPLSSRCRSNRGGMRSGNRGLVVSRLRATLRRFTGILKMLNVSIQAQVANLLMDWTMSPASETC